MEIDFELVETDDVRHQYADLTDELARCQDTLSEAIGKLIRCQDRRDVLTAALEMLISSVDNALAGKETTEDLVAALESARKLVT